MRETENKPEKNTDRGGRGIKTVGNGRKRRRAFGERRGNHRRDDGDVDGGPPVVAEFLVHFPCGRLTVVRFWGGRLEGCRRTVSSCPCSNRSRSYATSRTTETGRDASARNGDANAAIPTAAGPSLVATTSARRFGRRSMAGNFIVVRGGLDVGSSREMVYYALSPSAFFKTETISKRVPAIILLTGCDRRYQPRYRNGTFGKQCCRPAGNESYRAPRENNSNNNNKRCFPCDFNF